MFLSEDYSTKIKAWDSTWRAFSDIIKKSEANGFAGKSQGDPALQDIAITCIIYTHTASFSSNKMVKTHIHAHTLMEDGDMPLLTWYPADRLALAAAASSME